MSAALSNGHELERPSRSLTLRGAQRVAWAFFAAAISIGIAVTLHLREAFVRQAPDADWVVTLPFVSIAAVLLNAFLFDGTCLAVAWMWSGDPSYDRPRFVVAAWARRYSASHYHLALLATIVVFGLPATFLAVLYRLWGGGALPDLAYSPAAMAVITAAPSLLTALVPARRWGSAIVGDERLLVTWDDGISEDYAWPSLPTLTGLIHAKWRATRGHRPGQLRDFAFVGPRAARGYALAHERWSQAKQLREAPPSTASYRSRP